MGKEGIGLCASIVSHSRLKFDLLTFGMLPCLEVHIPRPLVGSALDGDVEFGRLSSNKQLVPQLVNYLHHYKGESTAYVEIIAKF